MIEIIFVRLATHLPFYVGTPDCQIKYDSSKVKINQIKIESTDNSLTNN
jgi:hypothetical protein